MYRQSAFGRIPQRAQSEVSIPENYSGSAFREQILPEETAKAEERLREEPAPSVCNAASAKNENATAEPSLFSGITEKLSGDSLLLLAVLLSVLGGGGERDDGAILALLILLLL